MLPKCNHTGPWWARLSGGRWAHGIHIPSKDSSHPWSSRTDVQYQASRTPGTAMHFMWVSQNHDSNPFITHAY